MSFARSAKYHQRYNLYWPIDWHPAEIEMECIRRGGQWKKKDGAMAGEGLFYHHKRLQQILHPEKVWHRWNDLILQSLINHRVVGIIGPASSGKSREASDFARMSYYIHPYETTVICSSTEKETLEDRIWGEIKAQHKAARRIYPELPGHLIESRQRIVTDDRDETGEEGRDFRNGLCGVPCKKGGSYVGLGCFPTGTQVDTPSGKRGIETIKVGDTVLSAIGPSVVRNTMIRKAQKLVRMFLSDGTCFDCTPEHPILTASGWTKAIDVSAKTDVISADEAMLALFGDDPLPQNEILLSPLQGQRTATGSEVLHGMPSQDQMESFTRAKEILFQKMPTVHMAKTMRVLRENIHSQRSQNHLLRQILLREMEMEATGKSSEISRSPQAMRQGRIIPEGQCRCYEQSSRASQATTASIKTSKFPPRQSDSVSWSAWSDQSRVGLHEAFPDSKKKFLRSDWKCSKTWRSRTIFFRFCMAETKVERGIGRMVSPRENTASQRQGAGRFFTRTKVDRVEILESGTDERFSSSSGGYQVHNLEVEGHPSYSVNGVLVHNSYAGRKNKYVILLADEGSFMPRAYVDAFSNLNKNRNFKGIISGNPKETTDALGIICEPAAELGGWDGGIDQGPKTKTWAIRFPEGICVQLVGSDSPNLDGKLGIPLINQEQIDADIKFYGKDSLQFTMMDEGRMPRGQGLRRVITRQMCPKFGAMEEPVWKSEERTRIFFMDAAYGRVGGDRCVGGELQFGPGLDKSGTEINLLALIDTLLVPVSATLSEMPEDQIVHFVQAQCLARGIPPENVFFDSTGRGSLMSAFARIWSPLVNGVEFGGKATERQVSNQIEMTCREYYFNMVSELWYSVRLVIESGQFRGLTEEAMLEGAQREWGFVASNKIQVEPKDKMKEKSGRSPDIFDAVVAGVEGARRKGFVIQRLDLIRNPKSDLWKRDLRQRVAKMRERHQLTYS